jgi:hypothetical protein
MLTAAGVTTALILMTDRSRTLFSGQPSPSAGLSSRSARSAPLDHLWRPPLANGRLGRPDAQEQPCAKGRRRASARRSPHCATRERLRSAVSAGVPSPRTKACQPRPNEMSRWIFSAVGILDGRNVTKYYASVHRVRPCRWLNMENRCGRTTRRGHPA